MSTLARTGFVVLALLVTTPFASAQNPPPLGGGNGAVVVDAVRRTPPLPGILTEGRYAVAPGSTLVSVEVRHYYFDPRQNQVGLEFITATTGNVSYTARTSFPPPGTAVGMKTFARITVDTNGVQSVYGTQFNNGNIFPIP